MKTFEVFRGSDASGVSGTGKVAEGVIFEQGFCVLRWCTQYGPNSFVFYGSFADFLQIHCYSHPGNDTTIKYSDGEELHIA